jgi:hypothetical protein
VCNGGFQADTTYAIGWQLENATVAISGGVCTVTATADGGRIYQTISGLRPLAEYRVGVSVNGGASANAARIYTTGGAQNLDITATTTDSAVVGGIVRTDASGTAIVVSLSVVTSGQAVTFDDVAMFNGNTQFWATHNALDMWRHHTDATKLDGGDLYAGSVADAALATAPHAAVTVTDTATLNLTLTGQDVKGDVIIANHDHTGDAGDGGKIAGVSGLSDIDTDTYNDSAAKVLGTDADGGGRVDHWEVGNVTGAVEGDVFAAGTARHDNERMIVNNKDTWWRKAYHKDCGDWAALCHFTVSGATQYGGGFIDINVSGYKNGLADVGACFSRWYYKNLGGTISVVKVGTDITAGTYPPQGRLRASGSSIYVDVASDDAATIAYMTVMVEARLAGGYQQLMAWTIADD